MMTTEIVRRLREACTGGRDCQCSYRLAADEIERLQADCEMWQRQSGEHADQIKELVTEVYALRAENEKLKQRNIELRSANGFKKIEDENAVQREWLKEAHEADVRLRGELFGLTEQVEQLQAENAALRDELRKHCIQHPTTKPFGWAGRCAECNTTWTRPDPEQHAPGCLAAPRSDE